MARLGRGDVSSYGNSIIRPPAVLDGGAPPEPLARPVAVHLTAVTPTPRQRNTYTRLSPPAVLHPSISFGGPRVKLTDPFDGRQRSYTTTAIRPPAVVEAAAAAELAPPVDVDLAKRRPRPVVPQSRIGDPQVIDPQVVFGSAAATLARTPLAARFARSRLRAPQVVDAQVVFGGPAVTLARTPIAARFSRSDLRPPQVIDPQEAFPGPDVHLAIPPRQQRVSSNLRPPEEVTAEAAQPLAAPIRSSLAPQPRPTSQSRLRAPEVVDAAAEPVAITTLSIHLVSRFPNPRHRDTLSRLQLPQVLYPVISFGGPRVKLAPPLQRFPQVHSTVRGPGVVDAVAPADPVETVARVTLAPYPRRRLTKPFLREPQVVDAAVAAPVVTDLRVALLTRGRRPRSSYRVAGPAVIRPHDPVEPIRVHLAAKAAFTAVRRNVNSALRKPAVVDTAPQPPVVTTLSVNLAWWRRPRLAQTDVRAPQVVTGPPPVVTDLSINLTDRRGPRLTRSDVRNPAVVGAAIVFRPVEVTLNAVRAGVEAQTRRQPFYRLRPPPRILQAATVFRPVRTVLAALKERIGRVRRGSDWELRPPAALDPPLPDLLPVVCDDLTAPAAVCEDLTGPAPDCDDITSTGATDDGLSAPDAGNDSLTFPPA